MELRTYAADDENAVVELWRRCELTRPWNDPRKDIRRKLTTQPELFLVGELKIGYTTDEAVSLGKRLIPDVGERKD